MAWFFITLIFTTILDIITISWQPTLEKDLEILVLRQQISILHRKLNSPIRPSRAEKHPFSQPSFPAIRDQRNQFLQVALPSRRSPIHQNYHHESQPCIKA